MEVGGGCVGCEGVGWRIGCLMPFGRRVEVNEEEALKDAQW